MHIFPAIIIRLQRRVIAEIKTTTTYKQYSDCIVNIELELV